MMFMVQLSDRRRREIVHQELTKLRDGNYLEETTFKQVMHASLNTGIRKRPKIVKILDLFY